MRLRFVQQRPLLLGATLSLEIPQLSFNHLFCGELVELYFGVALVQIGQGACARLGLQYGILSAGCSLFILRIARLTEGVEDALLQQRVALACKEEINGGFYFGELRLELAQRAAHG